MGFRKIEWTDAKDSTMRRLRAAGESWDTIARTVGASRSAAKDRGREIGIPTFRAIPKASFVGRMSAGVERTEAHSATITRLRRDGHSWDAIADRLGISRSTAIQWADPDVRFPIKSTEPETIERDVRDGAQMEALPAGHPFTWGLLTRGTCLEGSEYVHAVIFRQPTVRGKDFVAHANAIGREVPAAPLA